MGVRGSKPGERRGGRKRGTPNKLTTTLRDVILGALDDAGGRAYLMRQAEANPAAFLALVGRLVPSEVKGEITGANGVPLMPSIIIGRAPAIEQARVIMAGNDTMAAKL